MKKSERIVQLLNEIDSLNEALENALALNDELRQDLTYAEELNEMYADAEALALEDDLDAALEEMFPEIYVESP